MTSPPDHVVGCIVLTMGNRPQELRRAVDSLLAQRGVEVDVVVVGNGWQPTGLPARVRGLALPTNAGIPAGRHAGVTAVSGDLLLFCDDDAALADEDTLSRLVAMFDADRSLGIVQPRPVDPQTGQTPRRFVPRLRVGDPTRSSRLNALWEGVLLVRRQAYADAGGWAAEYFYAHEGVELAWRSWDAGWSVRYAGDVVVWHDAVMPTRHAEFHRLQARNRVWLARRNLPVVLGVLYVLDWVVLTVVRTRSPSDLRQSFAGLAAGLRAPCGERRRLRWRTVARMTSIGRPPVI
jgi:GT2 family glycosyltransferase